MIARRTFRTSLIPVLALALGLGALQGCASQREGDFAFDGEFFRAKARKDGDRREIFTVNVRPVSASLAGARAAGAYEATRYCIDLYGNSEVEWLNGPDAPAEALLIDGDTLTLRGECEG